MTVGHPFRFIAPMPSLDLPPARWRDEVRRMRSLGFATVAVSEHVAHGWAMDSLAVMAAAAAATERLRVLSLVLMNDLRHPALLHRALATIDRISEGRLEAGIGAGWQAADYEALGWPLDPPSLQIERLAESLEIIDRLFGGEEVNFAGEHYQVRKLRGCHEPSSSRGHRCSWVAGAGGSWRIRGPHCRHRRGSRHPLRGRPGLHNSVVDFGADQIAGKVAWITATLAAAGRPANSVELQFSVYLCRIGGAKRAGRRIVSTFADRLAVDPELVDNSPSVLIGSVDDCADLLEERRERYGFSYLRLSDEIDNVAPWSDAWRVAERPPLGDRPISRPRRARH